MLRLLCNAPPEGFGEQRRKLHPLRLQYDLFCDANPWMMPVDDLAEQVKADRYGEGRG
jgi:hypothetical protein